MEIVDKKMLKIDDRREDVNPELMESKVAKRKADGEFKELAKAEKFLRKL